MLIEAVFIHCSATRPGQDIGAAEIRRWHTDPAPRGNGWADIGYHFVIRRDGTVDLGRDLDGDGNVENEVGAHAYGHNRGTLGICLIGGVDDRGRPDCNFTRHQWAALDRLVFDIVRRHPQARVRGHRDVDAGKACPTFDAERWWNAR